MTVPVNEKTLAKLCDADQAVQNPWLRLSRHETGVSLDKPPQMLAWREPFGLWESVQYQAFRRRHLSSIPA